MSTVPPTDYDLSEDGPVFFVTLNNNTVTVASFLTCLVQVVTSVFVLLLNGLVLDTMVRQGKAREPADLLVAGLALSDVIMGLFVLWAAVYTLAYFQKVYECLARLGLAHAAAIIGKMHLLFLTMDRFLKIVLPYRYNNVCQKWTVWTLMGAAWLLGLLLGYMPLFGWNGIERPRNPRDQLCNYFFILRDDYLLMIVGLSLGIMMLMTLLYLKIFTVARRHAAAIAAISSQPGETTGQVKAPVHSHVWRYTKTVLFIVGTNSATWMPMATVVVLSASGTFGNMSTERRGDFIVYTSTLVYCNSLLNPLIYAAKIPAIRRRYRAIFCCCLRGTDRLGPTSTDQQLSRGVTTAALADHQISIVTTSA